MRAIAMMLSGLCMISAVPASATVALFDLSIVDPGAGLAAGPYGTVTVEESGGSLLFTETLNPGFKIHDGNSNHNAFAFSLVGTPAITISNLTSGFAQVSGAVSAPPFATGGTTFAYAIDCTSCGPGYPGGFTGPLSFKVTANSGSLSLASLQSIPYLSTTVYFASDLVDSAGKTGNVGAIVASSVPEPSTWAMLLIGFGSIGVALRRKRQTAGQPSGEYFGHA